MSGNIRRHGRRCAELIFVAAVSAVLLALVANGTARGPEALPQTLVYAFAAGFGLEFVCACWRGRWRAPGTERQIQR